MLLLVVTTRPRLSRKQSVGRSKERVCGRVLGAAVVVRCECCGVGGRGRGCCVMGYSVGAALHVGGASAVVY